MPPKGHYSAVFLPDTPNSSVLTVRIFTLLACVENGEATLPIPTLALSEEREEPMSSDPTSDDEQSEIDDMTLSEVVRRPTRTAGDLSEVADASLGITTADLARDLEQVAAKQGVATESELLADLLERVERIEEQLGIGRADAPELFGRVPWPPFSVWGYSRSRSSGREHPPVRTPSGEDPDSSSKLSELIERAQRSRDEEVDRPEESSEPEDLNRATWKTAHANVASAFAIRLDEGRAADSH